MSFIARSQDNRTRSQFKRDFNKGTKAEKAVMVSFNTYYRAHGLDCWSEKIGEDAFLDGEVRHQPDYYFYKPEKHTLEIKISFTGKFKNDTIAIRPGSVFEMKNRPKIYPNGKVLVATPREFSTISVEKLDECEYFHIPENFMPLCFLYCFNFLG